MIYVRVPATSANMGAGFDSLGIALGLYNHIRISEIDSGIVVYNNSKDFIPIGERNLIYRAVSKVFDEVGYEKKGIKIIQNSEIPVTRGLGSSSACIIGGMLAANVISGRKLSYKEILDLATEMEGHPDNVTPALFGGFCASGVENGKTVYSSTKLNPKLKIAIMVPDFFVSTRASRTTLPENVALENASYNISRATLLTSLLINGKYDDLRYAVSDRIHQDFRKDNIPFYDSIMEKSYELGSKATYLSGSGPTMVSLLTGDYSDFEQNMQDFLNSLGDNWSVKVLSLDNVGAILKEY